MKCEKDKDELDIAIGIINDYCQEEFQEGADVDDLSNIPITYTTITDYEIPLQISVDLVGFALVRELDGKAYERRQYDSLSELISRELQFLDFHLLISVSDEDLIQCGLVPEGFSSCVPLNVEKKKQELKKEDL